jgi:hypothetical protein
MLRTLKGIMEKLYEYIKVVGGLSALDVLYRLRSELTETSTFSSLRDQIAEAEVIVFFANPRGDPSLGGVQGGMEACITYYGCRPPDDCTSELYAPYVENLESIYEEIFALREGKPTIVRAVDFYNPLISEHRECGMEIQCIQCFDIFNAAVRRAAETFSIPLVSVYDEFNGLSHDDDPRERGLIGPDGKHTSEQGQQVIADLLSGLGYEPVEP